MKNINKSLNAIRRVIDMEISKNDIEGIKEKIIQLQMMEGLSAECKAAAKKMFDQAQLNSLRDLQNTGVSPSVLLKQSALECFEQDALLTYADRINAAIHHSLDGLRSILSLYKEEIKATIG